MSRLDLQLRRPGDRYSVTGELNKLTAEVDKSQIEARGGLLAARGAGNATLFLERARESHALFPFELVPAAGVEGYTPPEPDAEDEASRTYFVRYGLLNGVRVKGTLTVDGKFDDSEDYESVPVIMPANSTEFVVYIYGQTWAAGTAVDGEDTIPDWAKNHCSPEWHFVDDTNELAPPEVRFGERDEEVIDEKWTTYPCQPDPVGLNPHTIGEVTTYRSTRQPFAYPVALLTSTTEEKRTEQNAREFMDVWFEYVGMFEGVVQRYQPFFHPSVHVTELEFDGQLCDQVCDNPTGRGPAWGNGGGLTPEEKQELLDEIERRMGHWLYRVYQVGDTTSIAMEDGHLYTGSGDGTGTGLNAEDPMVVPWEGATVPAEATEANPFLVVLQVDFQNLGGQDEGETLPQFQAEVWGGLLSGLGDLTPELYTNSVTPDDWPEGYTISNTDNGTLYLIIAAVHLDEDGAVVIKEHFRDQCGFFLSMEGGEDGVTAESGLLIPKHIPHLACGRPGVAISPLLDGSCFTVKEGIGSVQLYKSADGAELTWTLQKKTLNRYYYMGQLAYQKLDDDWSAAGGDDVTGWDCNA
jgi:hypothetical protein